jgi:hypothetical protein
MSRDLHLTGACHRDGSPCSPAEAMPPE